LIEYSATCLNRIDEIEDPNWQVTQEKQLREFYAKRNELEKALRKQYWEEFQTTFKEMNNIRKRRNDEPHELNEQRLQKESAIIETKINE
jgi:hypothetical protein